MADQLWSVNRIVLTCDHAPFLELSAAAGSYGRVDDVRTDLTFQSQPRRFGDADDQARPFRQRPESVS